MDLDEARAVIAEQYHVVLATLRSDGTPQMSPVVVAVDAAGRVIISTRQASYKVRNLRRVAGEHDDREGIANCCLARELPLATLNLKDFADFVEHEGLELVH